MGTEINTTASSIEPLFRQFLNNVMNTQPKIDPELIVKILLFELNLKRFVGPDIPHVNLYVYYKDGTDLHKKQEEGRDKYPIEITQSRWGDGVIFSGLMGIRHVETICSDPDIVRVTGKATPQHN
ncbi:MAG: hypothetical protein H2B05_05930 [Nitrosopumilaceae archaeon]|jgi:hypothetical protein|uniref:Uncharacterized protein n=3 Tax=Candidatus Nitrosomaritimum aestuariumsis TaxID=3342354 RepID=A0AC60W473_9ARCH|nr:hypothetical protein [Nitrosopumilaceae archaeon]MBA4454465.1 hypothetical protein [Nitrosopumilaceae archaeon]MBA4459966.1 hypothetical protein [Nitrosopumilaceae archaeon]MBA4460997.1 hypothetical protein [Nitrosopumilaceae archaeon]MBA4463663.1 hypothetical protein [Nitrosopumilaceae archaeon]